MEFHGISWWFPWWFPWWFSPLSKLLLMVVYWGFLIGYRIWVGWLGAFPLPCVIVGGYVIYRSLIHFYIDIGYRIIDIFTGPSKDPLGIAAAKGFCANCPTMPWRFTSRGRSGPPRDLQRPNKGEVSLQFSVKAREKRGGSGGIWWAQPEHPPKSVSFRFPLDIITLASELRGIGDRTATHINPLSKKCVASWTWEHWEWHVQALVLHAVEFIEGQPGACVYRFHHFHDFHAHRIYLTRDANQKTYITDR